MFLNNTATAPPLQNHCLLSDILHHIFIYGTEDASKTIQTDVLDPLSPTDNVCH